MNNQQEIREMNLIESEDLDVLENMIFSLMSRNTYLNHHE